MRKKVLYSLKSPYREQLDVSGYCFGHGQKALAIVGAMRGNEVQQMYICSRMVQELKKLETEDKIADNTEIMVVPCVNYYSMNIGKRFWAMDNTNINRMFPRYAFGETTQRIADGLFSKLQGYRFGIQMASFYQSGDFLPHVKMMDTGFTDAELMKQFGFRYALIRKPRPYDTTTLNYNWQIWETKAFSVYSNATDRIDEASAQEVTDGILRFMHAEHLIKTKIRPGYQTDVLSEKQTAQVQAHAGGIFKPCKQVGDAVEYGECLARVMHPFDGTLVSEIRSPVTGTIYFSWSEPLISEKTVCFKIIT
jgi:predicted deacylase